VKRSSGRVLVIGTGASLVTQHPNSLIYADLARWEVQRRPRAHNIGNLGLNNANASAAALYKRAYFLDWRAADRLKTELLARIDFLLDTNDEKEPKLISGDNFRLGLRTAACRPFRVVPFFDAGPWGGQWMKQSFNLPDAPRNLCMGFLIECPKKIVCCSASEAVEWKFLRSISFCFCPHELLGQSRYHAGR
jgi:hypothetical protein